jgi:hypothetical protein
MLSESLDFTGYEDELNYTDFGELEPDQSIIKIMSSWECKGFDYELLAGDNLNGDQPISGEDLTNIMEGKFIIRTGVINEIIDEPQPLGAMIDDILMAIADRTIDEIIELINILNGDKLTEKELYKYAISERNLSLQMTETGVICDYALITNLPDWTGESDSSVQLYLNFISEDMKISFDQRPKYRTVFQRYNKTNILIKLKTPVAAGYYDDTKYNTITIWGRDQLRWTAYVTMLPTGYESWIREARTFLVASIGSTYATETKCSRIILTRGLSALEIGNICLIPFWMGTEPSFDVVTKNRFTLKERTGKTESFKLDGSNTYLEGWEFRVSLSLETYADYSTKIIHSPGNKHVVIGGLKLEAKCSEMLFILRHAIDTTRILYAYTRKMLNSKEFVVCTQQDLNTAFITEYIPEHFLSTNIDTYCYVQNHIPGKDKVGAYSNSLGNNKTAMHWGYNSQAQFNV